MRSQGGGNVGEVKEQDGQTGQRREGGQRVAEKKKIEQRKARPFAFFAGM